MPRVTGGVQILNEGPRKSNGAQPRSWVEAARSMTHAFICDAVRTPIGRYGGALAGVRPDDLAAFTLASLLRRNPSLEPAAVDEVVLGCANQSGEDNRNVARMASLLAGLPAQVPAITVNRLCASGLDAVVCAARAIRAEEAAVTIAGGVESMSRAPFVLGKADTAFSRQAELFDTTLGWRFVNPQMRERFGVDSMPETAENVATEFSISREDQDAFALRSQRRAADAEARGFFRSERLEIEVPHGKGKKVAVNADEHPRATTTLEQLARLPAPFRSGGSVTAGNSSGINDGACALVLAREDAARRYRLEPKARIVAAAAAGVEPRLMGVGPILAIRSVLARSGLALKQMDVIELNEAFASQALAVLRALGIPDDAAHVNPNGGAIALGHPLGMSGARLVATAAYQLHEIRGRYALCSMCVGVGQGVAVIIERV